MLGWTKSKWFEKRSRRYLEYHCFYTHFNAIEPRLFAPVAINISTLYGNKWCKWYRFIDWLHTGTCPLKTQCTSHAQIFATFRLIQADVIHMIWAHLIIAEEIIWIMSKLNTLLHFKLLIPRQNKRDKSMSSSDVCSSLLFNILRPGKIAATLADDIFKCIS